jgi:hypothetical protein
MWESVGKIVRGAYRYAGLAMNFTFSEITIA